jgi:hypothetical protein
MAFNIRKLPNKITKKVYGITKNPKAFIRAIEANKNKLYNNNIYGL